MIEISALDERINYFAPQAVIRSGDAVRLERFPKSITAHLQNNIGPLANLRSSSGCYLSFKCDSPWIKIELKRLRHHQFTASGMDCQIQLADGSWHSCPSQDLRCVQGDVSVRFASGLERGKALNTARIYLPLISTCAVASIKLTRGSTIEQAEIPAATWLAIGDSLTQGFSVQSPSQHWLQACSDRFALPAWNLGLGGLGIDSQVFEWALAEKQWPFISIGLGSNQAWSIQATAETSNQCSALIECIKKHQTNAKLVWLLPPWKPMCDGLGPSEYMGVPLNAAAAERLAEVIAAIRDCCAQAGVDVLDNLLPHNHRVFVDGLHPGALGMQHYAQAVSAYLEQQAL